MTDEFFSLKVMVVAADEAEREILRRGISNASIPIMISEVEAAGGDGAARRRMAKDFHDIVLFNSNMPASAQQALLDAVRATSGCPLAVLIGGAESDVAGRCDALIARPIEEPQVAAVIGHCIEVRLPKRVLIVDDSAAVRAVIQKVLNGSRFRIQADEADGYAAAIEKVQAQAYDVVILDCEMSGKDGFETLAALRTIGPRAKILMITERRDAGFEDRARGEGASEFLYKPFFAKDIDAAFGRMLALTHLQWA